MDKIELFWVTCVLIALAGWCTFDVLEYGQPCYDKGVKFEGEPVFILPTNDSHIWDGSWMWVQNQTNSTDERDTPNTAAVYSKQLGFEYIIEADENSNQKGVCANLKQDVKNWKRWMNKGVKEN